MDIRARKQAFIELGERIRDYGNTGGLEDNSSLYQAVEQSVRENPWFTEESVRYTLGSIAGNLSKEQLDAWTNNYVIPDKTKTKTIAVVMAGNIPAVGFHDFLSVLISGHSLLAKLSSDDRQLLPALAEILIAVEPDLRERIRFTEERVTAFDAVIATGSNNTSRYFEYYFGRYPHIIRKNRNGVGVITGHESDKQLQELGVDIFTYYGLGCRNVSKLFIPGDYDLTKLFEAFADYEWVGDHHKYRNNYDYNKSIFLVNGEPHFDNGFLLLKEDAAIASPVSVLNFERFDEIGQVNQILEAESENIQCVVSANDHIYGAIPPGTSQHPKLWDYADGIDTMEFLLALGDDR